MTDQDTLRRQRITHTMTDTTGQLERIFSLTTTGAEKIVNGDDWRPEYDAWPRADQN